VKVNALIEKASVLWDERNTEAVKRGEAELPRMLPLIRLKVILSNARLKVYFLPW
jgi:double-strand break repair protein MRE11